MHIVFWFGKSEGQKPIGRPQRICEGNIKVDRIEIAFCRCVNFENNVNNTCSALESEAVRNGVAGTETKFGIGAERGPKQASRFICELSDYVRYILQS